MINGLINNQSTNLRIIQLLNELIGLVLQVVLSLIICSESVPAGLIGKAAGPNMLKDSVLLVQVDPL